MTQASVSRGRIAPLLLSVLGLLAAQVASAKSGGVDYSWGAGALARAHDYTVTMMLYVLYVCYAVGSLMAIISALQIYFKMQYGNSEGKWFPSSAANVTPCVLSGFRLTQIESIPDRS